MKMYGFLCIAVGISMLLTPMAAIDFDSSESEKIAEIQTQAEETVKTAVTTEKQKEDTISVFMTTENETEVMDMRDYIIGAVAAEVPASYDEEAIKAQALAAVTFAEYKKKNGTENGIQGADISDDSSKHQGYMTKEEMKSKWGDAYESYYRKIADAVDDVIDKVIVYDDEPIMAAYHAISSGRTESAENMWGEDIEYLVSVDSEWDTQSTRYKSEVVLTPDDIENFMEFTDNADFSTEKEEWIKITEVSESGTVLEADVCGVSLTGMEVRNLFSLRSPVFSVEYSQGEYVFTVSGYGHGVGMSQNGANCMAQNGSTYEEIIKHYYKGVTIVNR